MERRELGRSGISVTRIVLGCGNFGGVGSAPAFFGQGISREEAPRIMDAAWDARDHDVRHRGRLRRRTQRDLDRRVARDEGLRCARRDHDRDEDVQPHGRRASDRGLVAASDPRQIETSLRAAGRRACRALHGARASTTRRPSRRRCRRLRRARARGEGRRRRRVELHRGAARGGGRDLGARGAHALRVGAELVLAARPERRRDRVPGLSRARARLPGVQPDRRRLARRDATGAARATRRDRA